MKLICVIGNCYSKFDNNKSYLNHIKTLHPRAYAKGKKIDYWKHYESVVIVRHGNLGYVAHVRYKNPKYDFNLSHTNKNYLHRLIEGCFDER